MRLHTLKPLSVFAFADRFLLIASACADNRCRQLIFARMYTPNGHNTGILYKLKSMGLSLSFNEWVGTCRHGIHISVDMDTVVSIEIQVVDGKQLILTVKW
jgi:hypothetical protein